MSSGLPAIWRVVGGADAGGILVRAGPGLGSTAEPERLETGAMVQEQILAGERMCYQLLEGSGPSKGWVSIRTKDKDLLVRTTPELPKTETSWLVSRSEETIVADDAHTKAAEKAGDQVSEEALARAASRSHDAQVEARFESVGGLIDDLQGQFDRLAEFSAHLFQELSDLHADHSKLRKNHMALCSCLYGRNLLQPDQLGVVLASEKRSCRMSTRFSSILKVMDDSHTMEGVWQLVGRRDAGMVHLSVASRAFGRLRTAFRLAAMSDNQISDVYHEHHQLDGTVWHRLSKFEPSEQVLRDWSKSQTVQAVLGSQTVEGIIGKTDFLKFKDVYAVFNSLGLALDQFVNKFRHMPCSRGSAGIDLVDVQATADAVLRRFASSASCPGGRDVLKCRDVYRLLEIIGCPLKRFKETFPTAAAVVENPGDGSPQSLVRFGNWQIRRVIGQGFKGVRCYLAESAVSTNQWVAIKWPAPRDEVAAIKDIQAKAPKGCLGLPQILNFGTHQGQHYIVFELLGSPLTKVFERLEQRTPDMKWHALRIIGRLMVRRLQAFHSCGYVHCDMSPENILLGRSREPASSAAASKTATHGNGSASLDGVLNASLYLIDFELAQRCPGGSKTESHIGSAEWSSIRSADYVSRVPEDDLEALGWVLANGLLGPLPWFEWLAVAYRDWESKWTRDQTVKQVQRAKMHFIRDGWKATSWTYPTSVPDELMMYLRTCSITADNGANPDYSALIELLGGNPDMDTEQAEREDLRQFAEHVTPLL